MVMEEYVRMGDEIEEREFLINTSGFKTYRSYSVDYVTGWMVRRHTGCILKHE